jgi:2,4-dienoyl-CoA reductase (NADPH2)
MEAARVAALRGHDVFLFEKAHQLGGLMPLAAIVKDLEGESILDTIRYLKKQITKLGVKVTLGKEADSSLIEELTPGAIIVAVGGKAQIPGIPGIDNEKVVSSSKLHEKLQTALRSLGAKSLERLTKLWMPVGKKVVIIGGGVQGCQLAEFLIKRGRRVTLVDAAETLGEGLLAEDPFRLFPWLEEKGAILLAGVTYERITHEGLVIRTREGNRETLEADSILTALPLLANPGLARELEKESANIAIYRIGDCKESGFMHDAIADGFRVGAIV